jgi:hypothetical protein
MRDYSYHRIDKSASGPRRIFQAAPSAVPAAPAVRDPGWFGRPGEVSRRGFLAGLGAAAALAPLPAFPFALPTRPLHAPRPSDVCFSSRHARPEALEVARAFGATRLDWCYTTDAAFLANCRRAGMSVLGGALSPTLADRVDAGGMPTGRILDRQGQPVTAPWMRAWNRIYWGCMNNPDFRRTVLTRVELSLKAGIDWFLFDDAQGNAAAVRWGGCWCSSCRQQAAAEGVDLERDMQAFQQRSTWRFHTEMRAAFDRLAGRHVTLGFNCAGSRTAPLSDWIAQKFDLAFCEIDGNGLDPADVAGRLLAAEIAGRPQGYTLRSRDVALNRRFAAWCYAHGGHMICPWDVFLTSTPQGSDRLFGNPRDYADIFGLARALGPLLDQAAPSALPPAGSWTLDRPGLRASLRADPRGRFAVLHLVSFAEDAPMRLRLDPAAAAGPRPVAEAVAHVAGQPPVRFAREGRWLTAALPAATWTAVEMRLAS